MDAWLAELYALCLGGAFVGGRLYLRVHPSPAAPRVPWTTLLLTGCIALPTALQFAYPNLLLMLQRDPAAIRAGEWWRFFTPLFVQDGGMTGALFNLIALLLVGATAEQVWGGARLLVFFFLGGLVGEIAGWFWQPIGAGNSVGNFALAGSVAAVCFIRHASRAAMTWAAVTVAVAVVLVAGRDLHGPAALAGAGLAWLVSRWWPPQQSDHPQMTQMYTD